jgi:hypothetical protein
VSTDIIIGVGGTLAAVAVSLWPKLSAVLSWVPAKPVTPVAGVTYQQAMIALASVRARLVATGGVSEAAGKAIEAITHDLVEGSDK